LRSPFNVIIGYSELLISKFKEYSHDKIEKQLQYINISAKNTFDLLNNLLEWSRSQQGMLNFIPEEIIFSVVLENELHVLRQQAAQKELQINYTVKGVEYPVEADINAICTVIRNLVSNAIKFSNKKSSIEIALDYKRKNSFTFSVSDEGIGMDKDKVESLFKITGNASTKGTAGEKGTGLGLLLCADFIEKHKGRIWVISEEGQGSTFYFSIPQKQNI
jgi:signal transduction histidine kinase